MSTNVANSVELTSELPANAPGHLLLVAYHFPPLQGSTGMSRSLAFAKFLVRDHGWAVTVLTVHARAYERIEERNLALIPEGVDVVRAPALDTRRQLSFFGRYPGWLALPDRWQSWIAGGVLSGLRLAYRRRPDLIMSTYPIASAHCIGYALHRLTRVPWIAELRDPMAQDSYPPEPIIHRAFEAIERRVFSHASRVIVTTPGCAATYHRRFPDFLASGIHVITNGYDPDLFPAYAPQRERGDGPLRILHSGLLYPSERDPSQLFRALAELREAGRLDPAETKFLFRASGNETAYERTIEDIGLTGLVEFLPPIPYRDALAELMQVDALLVMQASNCNEQIPAKIYEYFYSGRPIVAMTDSRGDTAQALRKEGIDSIAPLDDANAIKALIVRFVDQLRHNTAKGVATDRAASYSRRQLTEKLAGILADAQGRRSVVEQS